MAQFTDYLKTAKDFADQYGVERLDRLMGLAEPLTSEVETQSHIVTANHSNILQEVEDAGLKITPYLKHLVLSESVETVRDAIAVVQENQSYGRVKNPEGLLVEAIRNRWKPKRLLFPVAN